MGSFDQAFSKIQAVVGDSHLKRDDETIHQYRVDGTLAQAVVFPSNTRQVADIVRLAGEANMALTVWGGGTKMGMGKAPQRLDLVLCTRRMNHVIDVDAANLTITVEAGVKFSEIQARLAAEEDRCYLPVSDDMAEFVCSDREHSGSFLPLDPSHCDQATMGGILAVNVTGPRRLLYGLPRDVVLGLRFVTPNGEVIGAGGKTVKNVSGYDISKLMIGSFGSLGILCEATLRLLPMPEKMQTLLFVFDGLDHATQLAQKIHNTHLLPAAVEIFNGAALASVWPEWVPSVDRFSHVVAVALEGFDEPVDRMRNELQVAAGTCYAIGSDLLKESRHRDFWRKASHLVDVLKGQWPQLISAKLVYPISQMPAIISTVQQRMSDSNLDHALWVHSGSGVCHLHCPADGEHVTEIIQQVLGDCLEAGGNLTIGHAPEAVKSQLPIWGNPTDDRTIMTRIKRQIDPAQIMSPGRFVV